MVIKKGVWNYKVANFCFVKDMLSVILWCIDCGYIPLVDIYPSNSSYYNEKKRLWDLFYEQPLKNMSISQGRLLIKLIDREIGKSSYKIIKDYKSGITAGFWQGVAKIFGNDLKSSYDAKGDDKMTEYLVEKWKRGEFDALYYSIFWEMPKHPEIKSKTIQFED